MWSKHTDYIIDLVDLGDVNWNYANFATKNAIASQIFPLLFKAVGIGETQCAIKVVAAACDGASATHKFFRMNFGLTHDDELTANTGVD